MPHIRLQCFELGTFMHGNLSVSGSRWRCASCELFLQYHELQLCGLTKAALDKFGEQVSAFQGRVEFRSDETFHLLPPQRLRHASKRQSNANANAGSSGNIKGQPPAPDEVILLD